MMLVVEKPATEKKKKQAARERGEQKGEHELDACAAFALERHHNAFRPSEN